MFNGFKLELLPQKWKKIGFHFHLIINPWSVFDASIPENLNNLRIRANLSKKGSLFYQHFMRAAFAMKILEAIFGTQFFWQTVFFLAQMS